MVCKPVTQIDHRSEEGTCCPQSVARNVNQKFTQKERDNEHSRQDADGRRQKSTPSATARGSVITLGSDRMSALLPKLSNATLLPAHASVKIAERPEGRERSIGLPKLWSSYSCEVFSEE